MRAHTARIAAAVAGLIALVSLAGWFLDVDALKTFVPGLPMIKANTAASLLALSMALALQGTRTGQRHPSLWRRALTAVLSTAVLVVLGVTLLEYVLGLNLGLDEVVVQDARPDPGVPPGRMVILTLIGLAAAAVALLSLLRRTVDAEGSTLAQREGHTIAPHEALGVVAVACASVSLVAMVYAPSGPQPAMTAFTQMALPTALGLAAIGVGLIFSRARGGISSLLTGDGVGSGMARRALPVLAAVPLLLGWLRLHGELRGLYATEFGVALTITGTIFFAFIFVIVDARRLNQADARRAAADGVARRAVDQLQAIFDVAGYPMAVRDLEGRFLFVNKERARVAGVAPEALVGKHVDEVLSPDDARAAKDGDREVLERGPQQVEAASLVNGAQVWWNIRRFALVDDAGAPYAVCTLAVDITEQKLAAEKIRQAKEETETLADRLLARTLELESANEELLAQREELLAQQEELQSQQRDLESQRHDLLLADRHKSEFLANVSHELRTPLNAINGFTELVLDEAGDTLNPTHTKFLGDVLASGRHLLSLINEILDLSRIEAGRLTLNLESLLPDDVVGEVHGIMRGLAQRRRIEIGVTDTSTQRVRADRGVLRQVLLNLLSNAVKFSAEGTRIDVTVSDRPGFVHFAVKDQGPGIDDALLARLFTPFVQGDSALSKRHQGTGLGLAISRRLVEAQGGVIDVDSAPGAGSTFWFTIPTAAQQALAASNGLPAALPTTTPATVERGRALVLAIDDEPRVGALLRAALEPAGFGLLVAESAPGGVALAHQHIPDVVIVDLRMPELSGTAVIDALDADPRTRGVPVIVLSGVEPLADERARLRGRVHAIALKGNLNRDELIAAVEQAAQPPTPHLAGAEAPLILVADDHDLNRQLVRSFLERAGYRVVTADDGAEAVAVAQAQAPSLIVMDLAMPVMDGYAATRALRADSTTARIPVIALTALAMRSDEEKAYAAGIDAYLTKPVERVLLEALIARTLAARRA